MKVIVDGEPEEIKKLLNAIEGSKEQLVTRKELKKILKDYVRWN
ncbi:hypothetical protein [Limosilactobacillus oris]|nr:hypothetical protein [Limosilactobacillus oris]